jgi:hypothetical protein
MSAVVKVFGCRPPRTEPPAHQRPAYENLQGTRSCSRLYGDLSAVGEVRADGIERIDRGRCRA